MNGLLATCLVLGALGLWLYFAVRAVRKKGGCAGCSGCCETCIKGREAKK